MPTDCPPPKPEHVSQFFYFLFISNLLMYMEAGAVPASLLPLAASFEMTLAQQGMLGGIVFLSIAFAGPFAGIIGTYTYIHGIIYDLQPIAVGYALKHYEHRSVLGVSFVAFTVLTVFWSLTPTHWPQSSHLFIFLRFLMGLCQCICCVFFPLW